MKIFKKACLILLLILSSQVRTNPFLPLVNLAGCFFLNDSDRLAKQFGWNTLNSDAKNTLNATAVMLAVFLKDIISGKCKIADILPYLSAPTAVVGVMKLLQSTGKFTELKLSNVNKMVFAAWCAARALSSLIKIGSERVVDASAAVSRTAASSAASAATPAPAPAPAPVVVVPTTSESDLSKMTRAIEAVIKRQEETRKAKEEAEAAAAKVAREAKEREEKEREYLRSLCQKLDQLVTPQQPQEAIIHPASM